MIWQTTKLKTISDAIFIILKGKSSDCIGNYTRHNQIFSLFWRVLLYFARPFQSLIILIAKIFCIESVFTIFLYYQKFAEVIFLFLFSLWLTNGCLCLILVLVLTVNKNFSYNNLTMFRKNYCADRKNFVCWCALK